MKIEYKHNLTADESYSRINKLLSELQDQYADKISNPKTTWNSDCTKMDFNMEIMGFKISGQVNLGNNLVTLNGDIPFMLKPFSGKIESMIRSKLDELLS